MVTWWPAPSAARGWTSVPSAGSTLSGLCTSLSRNASPASRQLLRLRLNPKTTMQLTTFYSAKDFPCECWYFLYSPFFCTSKYNKKGLSLKFCSSVFPVRVIGSHPPLSNSLGICISNLCPFLNVYFFLFLNYQFSKAKNVWHSATCTLVKHNPSPSDLPINCSWHSAQLSILKSTSLLNETTYLSNTEDTQTHTEPFVQERGWEN